MKKALIVFCVLLISIPAIAGNFWQVLGETVKPGSVYGNSTNSNSSNAIRGEFNISFYRGHEAEVYRCTIEGNQINCY